MEDRREEERRGQAFYSVGGPHFCFCGYPTGVHVGGSSAEGFLLLRRSGRHSFRLLVEEGKGKCYGFVRFRERREAISTVRALNGSFVKGRKMQVNIAKSDWNTKRRNGKTHFHKIAQAPLVGSSDGAFGRT